MSPIVVSLLVAICIFAGGLAGMWVHRLVPAEHLAKETQDIVRLGTGMLSVLASLVLGLLIATAKTSYDTTDHAIRSYGADILLLNETLRDYGDGAKPPRELLRRYTAQVLDDTWPPPGSHPRVLENRATGELLEHVREAIRALAPVDAGQRWLQDQALTINISMLHQRWLLIEQEGPNIQPIVLGVLVAWIALIFASFGMNAPRNGTIVAAFLICSLSIGGSVFLILEMDDPFDGAMRISSQPIAGALDHMTP